VEEVCEKDVVFVDFMRDDEYDEDGVLVAEAPKIFEMVDSLEVARSRVQMLLLRYNEQFPSRGLNIILFDDALRHLLRISRCLGMPKGCILLVGVGEGQLNLT
jgi:dynein heavy chain